MTDKKPSAEIINLKRRLYWELLSIPVDEIRECDINLGYALCKDPDIQLILEQANEK